MNLPGYLSTSKYFLTGKFSDAVLECQGKEFKVHKLIVSAMSPVLKAMFSNEFKEGIMSRVVVKEAEAHTLEQMLRFIYTGEIQMITSDGDAVGLLMIADAYDIPKLKAISQRYLISKINEDNFVEFVELSKFVPGCEALFDGCVEFINSNKGKLSLEQEDIKNLMQLYPELAYSIIAAKYKKRRLCR